jgi:Pregnancy-associated plasma protein-A
MRPTSIIRVGVVAVALVISFSVHKFGGGRPAAVVAATGEHELTPEVRARTFTFDGTVAPADRAWILAAVAKARPEAQQLIGAIDGLVTIGTASVPDAPWVGQAQQGTDRVIFNTAYLDGERKQDRDQAVLHELGHIVDFELIPDATIAQLAAQLPSTGNCVTAETGDCTAPQERFADTFAKWALRGAVSSAGAGYQLMTPASLETWGQPLGLIAAQLQIQK